MICLCERAGCPLCGSAKHGVHIAFPEIPVIRCGGCGFLYSSMVMPAGRLNEYYAEEFGSQRHLQGQIVTARVNAWAARRLLGEHLLSVRIFLDVGTGYGFFLREIRDRFLIQGVGVELSRQEAAYGREVLSLDIRNVLLSDSGVPKNHYDLVTTFEVIEHTRDPRAFLGEVIEYVKPGGYCLVMTDNFESRVARSLGAGFPKWIPHAHISHFSAATFERLVRDSGMTITRRLSYTPWELLLRNLYCAARGKTALPSEVFNLEQVLESEMGGRFRLFRTRRALNRIWAQMQSRDNLDGAVMYILARKPPAV